jgi:hypothetical protein
MQHDSLSFWQCKTFVKHFDYNRLTVCLLKIDKEKKRRKNEPSSCVLIFFIYLKNKQIACLICFTYPVACKVNIFAETTNEYDNNYRIVFVCV